MGVNIGKVVGQRIGDFKELENVRILEVDLLGESPDTVIFLSDSGEDTAPVDGDMVIVFDNGSFQYSIATWDILAAVATAGQKRIYSRDSSGAVAALINFLADGQMQLNGTGDFAVRFNELETAFNQLKSDYDDLLNAVNNHNHAGVTAGTSSTGPLITGLSPSTADISGAKIDEIEVPA